MQSDGSTVSWVVVVMAACSLFSMIGTYEIDGIINHTLYNYGLQFSYAWANPYWTTVSLVFAMGWLNIVIAIGVHIHAFANRLKVKEEFAGETEKEMTPAKAVEEPNGEKTKTAEAKEEPKEEEAKTAEAKEEPKPLQVAVIDTDVQEKEEKPVEVKEASTEVKPEAERGEEQGVQESQHPEEPEAKQEETKPEPPKEGGEASTLSESSAP